MRATDLMIGDWVLISVWDCKPFPSKVTSINYNSYKGKDFADWIDTEDEEEIGMYNVQPIPITPEVLEKNFQKDPDYIDTYWRPDCRKFCFVKENDDWYFAFRYKGGHICIAECNYVHELQHALRLCGIDKEIVL